VRFDSQAKDKLIISEDSLQLLAERIQNNKGGDLGELVHAILLELSTLEIVDLWEPREAALTYWILLLSGANQTDEMKLASDLLTWQAFFAKDSARILCVQSSEREAFRCCSSTFDVHDCPTLIMSDSPDMNSYLRVEPDLLRRLTSSPGELQRFLTRLHALAENGRSLRQLSDLMAADAFWRGLKIVYNEVKGMVSIKL
jgi:hypothetical protein